MTENNFNINTINTRTDCIRRIYPDHSRIFFKYHPEERFVISPFFPGYWIGNFGTIIIKDGSIYENMILPVQHSGGYLRVKINYRYEDGTIKKREMKLNRVVMMAHCFVPNYNDLIVFHTDGNKVKCVYDPGKPWHNLKWIDRYENSRMIVLNNKEKFTNNNIETTVSGMSDELIHSICKLLEAGSSTEQVIATLGLEDDSNLRKTISNIKTGRRRKDISSKYNIDPSFNPRCYTEEIITSLCKTLEWMKQNNVDFRIPTVRYILNFCFGIGYEAVNDRLIYSIKNRYPDTNNWRYIADNYDF